MKFYSNKKEVANDSGINSKGGFTLLEVLVAVTILIFAIVATFTSAQSGLQSSQESKNQIISFYLAQEAIEYIRNVRDTNSIVRISDPAIPWLDGVAETGDPCFPGTYCVIDSISKVITQCPTGLQSCPSLMQNRTQGSDAYLMYGYDNGVGTWATTDFKRVVQIEKIGSNEARIIVTVYWSRGSFSTSFTVRETIFDWQT
jgi:type II secretory pathway pseudopilin PulG